MLGKLYIPVFITGTLKTNIFITKQNSHDVSIIINLSSNTFKPDNRSIWATGNNTKEKNRNPWSPHREKKL